VISHLAQEDSALSSNRHVFKDLFLLFLVLCTVFGWQNEASAGELQITWADNSENEDGFKIERKTGTAGTYAQIATVGANVTSYRNASLIDGTTYCYRIRAYNSAGSSPYSNEACGTVNEPFALTVAKTGTGSGTVTSAPAGIACGTDCSENYPSGTFVTLTAVPAAGSAFAGWSGDSDCSDGAVTMNGNKSCTATFQINAQTYTLSVKAIAMITSAGTGSGKVVSNPAGVDCGTTCSAYFTNGTAVTLTPLPATGSVFAGWSGDADCSDGSVTMNGNRSCTASFQIRTYVLTIGSTGTGAGKITSTPAGIDCGTTCSASFASGASVVLRATPDSGSSFDGWTGDPDCYDGSVTANGNKSCSAVFSQTVADSVGLFRAGTGEWFLRNNSNGWYGCTVDTCLGPFGEPGDIPIVGDWKGVGKTRIGVFNPPRKLWQLDVNGTGSSASCDSGNCLTLSFDAGSASEVTPVSGNWDGSGRDLVAVYEASSPRDNRKNKNRTYNGNTMSRWYLDFNGNGLWDGCHVDLCFGPFGIPGDLPVVGDWNGTGVAKIGVFDPVRGIWELDLNGNGKWDGCGVDMCLGPGLGPLSQEGHLPVVGDWNGSGTTKIGVFRPSTGEWQLDLNGNGKWDGCKVDKCISGFGQEGDLPVVGKWQ
jgi:hypothetical protein